MLYDNDNKHHSHLHSANKLQGCSLRSVLITLVQTHAWWVQNCYLAIHHHHHHDHLRDSDYEIFCLCDHNHHDHHLHLLQDHQHHILHLLHDDHLNTLVDFVVPGRAGVDPRVVGRHSGEDDLIIMMMVI